MRRRFTATLSARTRRFQRQLRGRFVCSGSALHRLRRTACRRSPTPKLTRPSPRYGKDLPTPWDRRSSRPAWYGPSLRENSAAEGRRLYGLDPTTGIPRYTETLPSPVIDHFASPSAAGGRLFVATRVQRHRLPSLTAPAIPPIGGDSAGQCPAAGSAGPGEPPVEAPPAKETSDNLGKGLGAPNSHWQTRSSAPSLLPHTVLGWFSTNFRAGRSGHVCYARCSAPAHSCAGRSSTWKCISRSRPRNRTRPSAWCSVQLAEQSFGPATTGTSL